MGRSGRGGGVFTRGWSEIIAEDDNFVDTISSGWEKCGCFFLFFSFCASKSVILVAVTVLRPNTMAISNFQEEEDDEAL
jgi:hypothetical protein